MTIAYDSSAEVVGVANPTPISLVPVGTLRGVVLLGIQNVGVADEVSGVTLNGVTMERIRSDSSPASPEPGRIYVYESGVSIPAGTLSISVGRSAVTSTIQWVAIGLTAAADVEVLDSDALVYAGTNPSLILQYAGRTGLTLAGLHSGVGSPTGGGITEDAGLTRVHDHDFGNQSGVVVRQTTAGATDFTVSFTTNAADALLVAVALGEVDPDVSIPVTPSQGGSSTFRSPAWIKNAITAVKDLKGLVTLLGEELSRFAQHVVHYEKVAVLTYGTVVRPSGNLRRVMYVKPTNTTAWAMANPTNPREGVEITFDIHNGSGGTMGTITWGAEYELQATFTKPANGKHRLISFIRMPDGKWRESRRSVLDLD